MNPRWAYLRLPVERHWYLRRLPDVHGGRWGGWALALGFWRFWWFSRLHGLPGDEA